MCPLRHVRCIGTRSYFSVRALRSLAKSRRISWNISPSLSPPSTRAQGRRPFPPGPRPAPPSANGRPLMARRRRDNGGAATVGGPAARSLGATRAQGRLPLPPGLRSAPPSCRPAAAFRPPFAPPSNNGRPLVARRWRRAGGGDCRGWDDVVTDVRLLVRPISSQNREGMTSYLGRPGQHDACTKRQRGHPANAEPTLRPMSDAYSS